MRQNINTDNYLMKLHAIYIQEFPPFKNCTINLDSRYDYMVVPNEASSKMFQIERVDHQEKFDVFKGYDCRVTGITGKNGSGKSTIGLLLKNIFSGKPIVSKDNKTLIIYEVDDQVYLDEYKPDVKYISYLEEFPLTFSSQSFERKFHNLTIDGNDNKSKKWKNVNKKIAFYSSVLSEVNDYYYNNDDIVNISIDYRLRQFIESKRESKKKADIFGFSNLVNDYFQLQSHDFIKMVFKLKREFPNDKFFNSIIELPDNIDYYPNIEIDRESWKKINIEIPEDKGLPFITKLYLTKKTTKDSINKAIADQLKALTIYHLIHQITSHSAKEKQSKFSELVLSYDLEDLEEFINIDDSLIDKFSKIDSVVGDLEFNIETSLFPTISTPCDEKAEALFDVISEINDSLGAEFISYNMKRRLSSGERVILNLFSSLEREKANLQGTSPIIFMDEIDQNLHPEWQRSIIYQLLKYFKSREITDVHLIFTTHSPFVVSEIPNNHLKTKADNDFVSLKGEMTFAGNISDVLFDVMNVESLNGLFTHEVINDALNYLNGKESIRFKRDEQINGLIKLIGEPLLRHHLEQMLIYKNQ